MKREKDDYQVENGKFTRIINASLEDLIGAKLNGTELAICLFIIRKTWGYRKKQDEISLTQIEKATGYTRRAVTKAVKKLKLGNKLTLVRLGSSKKASNIYTFNKYWKLENNSTLVQLGNKQVNQLGNKGIHTKETITKEINTFTHPSSKDAKTKNMLKYNEQEFSDQNDIEIGVETGEVIKKGGKSLKEPENLLTEYKKIIQWAENRRGKRFINWIKQMKAIKDMRLAGYSGKEIMNFWEDLEDDKFWGERGFDFMILASQMDKKGKK